MDNKPYFEGFSGRKSESTKEYGFSKLAFEILHCDEKAYINEFWKRDLEFLADRFSHQEREDVKESCLKIKELENSEEFISYVKTHTLTEASKKFGVKSRVLRYICNSRKIPYKKERGVKKGE